MIVHGNEVGVMFVALNVIYVALLLFVGTSMMRESCQARRRPPQGGVVNTKTGQAIRRIRILPLISLPVSKIESISVWMLVGLGFMVGVLSGLLGVGGGFVMSPCLIYLIGIPTSVAIGTDLFQIMFTSIYGTFTHFFKGNVDFLLVLWILLGSLGGSQLGAIVNKRVRGAHIRYYFSWIVLIAVGIIIIKFLMVTGYLPV